MQEEQQVTKEESMKEQYQGNSQGCMHARQHLPRKEIMKKKVARNQARKYARQVARNQASKYARKEARNKARKYERKVARNQAKKYARKGARNQE